MSKIFVFSGPSGSGKTTLAKELLKDSLFKKRVLKAISFTTRPKRRKEKEGKDYFFVNKKEFFTLLRRKKILEYTRYLGYYYGTSRDFVEETLKEKKNVILCLDLKGAKVLKKMYPQQTKTIFIMPPSLAELRKRIKTRSPEIKEEELQARLALAKKEIVCADKFDYCIINKDLKQSIKEIKDIVAKEINSQNKRQFPV